VKGYGSKEPLLPGAISISNEHVTEKKGQEDVWKNN
jgi:hypothetical protein